MTLILLVRVNVHQNGSKGRSCTEKTWDRNGRSGQASGARQKETSRSDEPGEARRATRAAGSMEGRDGDGDLMVVRKLKFGHRRELLWCCGWNVRWAVCVAGGRVGERRFHWLRASVRQSR